MKLRQLASLISVRPAYYVGACYESSLHGLAEPEPMSGGEFSRDPASQRSADLDRDDAAAGDERDIGADDARCSQRGAAADFRLYLEANERQAQPATGPALAIAPAGQASAQAPGQATQAIEDPIIQSAAANAQRLPKQIRALSDLAGSMQAARDRLDGDSVGALGLQLAAAYASTAADVQRLGEDLDNASLLGAVGVGYAWDPDGSKVAARDAEQERLDEIRADLSGELHARTTLIVNAIRPAQFRRREVPGVAWTMQPADVPTFIREQTIRSILLVDTLDEIHRMLAAAKAQPPDAGAEIRWQGDLRRLHRHAARQRQATRRDARQAPAASQGDGRARDPRNPLHRSRLPRLLAVRLRKERHQG